jgi:hypothetical protein
VLVKRGWPPAQVAVTVSSAALDLNVTQTEVAAAGGAVANQAQRGRRADDSDHQPSQQHR